MKQASKNHKDNKNVQSELNLPWSNPESCANGLHGSEHDQQF